MKKNIYHPDYDNSIMNLSCSVMKALGGKPKHRPLKHPCLVGMEKKENIVLIILDGMGANILSDYKKKNPKSILAKNKKTNISSVFPSTTSAAITSLRTGESPLEHGIIGWSLYFKEFGAMIEILPMNDSMTKMGLDEKMYPVMDFFQLKSIAQSILLKNKKVKCYDVIPEELKGSYYNTRASNGFTQLAAPNFRKMMERIASLSKRKGRKLIVGYSTYPDTVLHQEGLKGKSIKSVMDRLDKNIKWLAKKIEKTDTKLIITADHGLIDCKKVIRLNDHPKLFECMILPKFPESRFVSFFIKEDKKKQFEREIKKLKKDFIILTRKDFFKNDLLGPGKKHPKVDDFIGDYVIIGIGKAQIKQDYPFSKRHNLLAHHAGLTREEMTVPLIIIDFEKKENKK